MASCCGTTNCCETTTRTTCGSSSTADVGYVKLSELNTLEFKAELCINCGMCSMVCPHAVFASGISRTGRGVVAILRADYCMECGACERNCPTGALRVDSGVGCATAMINAALTGAAEPTC